MNMKMLKDVSGLGRKGDVIAVNTDSRVVRYKETGIAEETQHAAASRVPAESKPPTPTVTHRQVVRATTRRR